MTTDTTTNGHRRNPTTNRTVLVVGLIIIILGVTTLVFMGQNLSATKALRTSSARSECRTKITNEAEDLNRHDQAQLFVYVSDLIKFSRTDEARAATALGNLRDLAQVMKDRPHVQALIDEQCPAPLVKPTGQ